MKKKVVMIGSIVVVIALLFLVFFLGNRPLDLKSDEITTLYSYLGDVNINICGGLNQYTGDEVTYDSLSNNNKLCLAYYKLNNNQIVEDVSEITKTNEYDLDICEVGEGSLFVSGEDKKCHYKIISKDDLATSYEKIYGNELPHEEEFYISNNHACYLEGDEYYCGEAVTFTQSLTPESVVYRLMNKAVKELNGNIVIFDYYLKISGNKCYLSNSFDDENTECSKELENNPNLEINEDFVLKYGSLYKHTYKQDKNNNYYWFMSTLSK